MTTRTAEPGPTPGRVQSSDLLAVLRARIDEALRAPLGGMSRLALLEFPAHPNVGDSAIWAGEIEFLKARVGRRPVVTGDSDTDMRDRLTAMRNLDAILIHGGGNLGDLWHGLLETKIRVLEDFPHLPVIQLPQTIHFQDPARLDDYRRAVARHPRFTLLVRDQPSFDMASAALDCDVRLCPDMALWLDLARPERPRHDVVCMLRTDLEASAGQQGWRDRLPADVPVVDWLEEPYSREIAAERELSRAIGLYPRKLARLEAVLGGLRNRVAWRRVRRGCRLLGSGKAVITDRLHGHILCVLMGIPHVVLDNSYGKVGRFSDCWTRDAASVRFAASIDEAVDIARGLAGGAGR